MRKNQITKIMRSIGSLLPGIVLVLALSGCAIFDRGTVVDPGQWAPRISPDGDGAPELAPTQRPLRPGDRVVVTLRPSLSGRQETVEVIVDDEGKITLPLLGEFPVQDLNTSDAARAISQEYVNRGFYIDMIVNVVNASIKDSDVDEYSVTGEINRRGRFPLRPGLTLWQAIIAAGDVTAYASDTILLTRGGVTRSFSIKRIKRGRTVDPEIRTGDIIQVKARIF